MVNCYKNCITCRRRYEQRGDFSLCIACLKQGVLLPHWESLTAKRSSK